MDEKKTFQNAQELANYLKISRSKLFQNAKLANIRVATLEFTKNQLTQLKSGKINTQEQTESTLNTNSIQTLINALNNQLSEKDKQIEQLTKIIDQQQQLTLQTNKTIENLQKPVKDPIQNTNQIDNVDLKEKILPVINNLSRFNGLKIKAQLLDMLDIKKRYI